MKNIALIFLAFVTILVSGFAFALDQFATEAAAQKHCPADTVVWLNTATGVWHYKGQRWYGNTKHGAFVCMKEAAAEGDRGTKNGQ